MKSKRFIVTASLLVVIAVLASAMLVFVWQRSQPTFKGFPKLIAAVQSYSRDHVSRGQPAPASVKLRDLVSGGYISSEDARAFNGMDVTIYPTVNNTNLQATLVRVGMPDGTRIALLADGSVQQLPK